jgi:hypothetical protein
MARKTKSTRAIPTWDQVTNGLARVARSDTQARRSLRTAADNQEWTGTFDALTLFRNRRAAASSGRS